MNIFAALIGMLVITVTSIVLITPYIGLIGIWFATDMPMVAKVISTILLVLCIAVMKPITIIRTCHRNAINKVQNKH